MPVRGRFGGIFSRAEAAEWIELSPQLRELRTRLRGTMRRSRNPGDRARPASRAQEMVEDLLLYSFDRMSKEYVETVTPHIERIVQLRGEIESIYRTVAGLDPRNPIIPADLDVNKLGRLFTELEGNLRAIGEASPANHMRKPQNVAALDDVRADLEKQLRPEELPHDPDQLQPQEPTPIPYAESRARPELPPAPRQPRAPEALPGDHFVASREPIPYREDGTPVDIRDRFHFDERLEGGGRVKEASGELGDPRRVQRFRDEKAQAELSSGTGDDAGHLIGDQFGAPGDLRNLSPQNRPQNRFNPNDPAQNGAWFNLEMQWRQHLEEGGRVFVTVRDTARPGEFRPYKREASWTILHPDGRVETGGLTFANMTTPEVRAQGYTPPTVSGPQSGNLLPFPGPPSGSKP